MLKASFGARLGGKRSGLSFVPRSCFAACFLWCWSARVVATTTTAVLVVARLRAAWEGTTGVGGSAWFVSWLEFDNVRSSDLFS